MFGETLKTLRRKAGLSQEELAVRLNVVRQTVSKWEQGLSVPDADMLIALSETLETPVSTLLGETIIKPQADDLKAISEKLETINLQLAQRRESRWKVFHWLFIALGTITLIIFALLASMVSLYLGWDYADPETAVFGAAFHVFEYVFVRASTLVLIASIVGAVLTRNKN